MSDYISREETVKQITRVAERIKGDNSPYIFTALYLGNKEDFPSADVRENIHGEWKMPIQDDGMSDPIYYQVRCSKCGFDLDPQTWHQELHQYDADNFCPNCGADMRGIK